MRIEFGNGRRHSILSRDARLLRAGSGKLIQTPTATASTVVPAALSLRHNFSWTVIGNLVYALCQWGMLIVLAKLLSPEAVGQFALGLAITAPILLFTSLKLRSVLATDVGDQYRFADYLWLRLLTTLAALFADGLCLPSGSSMTEEDLDRVCLVVERCVRESLPALPAVHT